MNKFTWMAHGFRLALCLGLLELTACGAGTEPEPEPQETLTLNEVVSANDGVSIDETGQTADWLELANTGTQPLRLGDYAIADSANKFVTLPDVELAPGGVIQLWADDEPDLGPRHLPFKISASGDRIALRNKQGQVFAQVPVPALALNQSYSRFPSGSGAFALCRYATPGKTNGERCAPHTVPPLEDTVRFAEFPAAQWPASVAPQSLGINELALLPAQFVEFKNFSNASLNLSGYRLVLAAYPPTSGLPGFNQAGGIDLPSVTLAPGAVYALTVTTAQVAAIQQQAFNEGVAVVFNRQSRQTVDVVPFMHWPSGRSLTRRTTHPFRLRFCENATAGLDMECVETQSRTVGNRTRGLYTPGDFAKLAEGSGQSNSQSVKFIVDLQNQNAVHFLGSRDWALHYTFVRELIDRDPPLNRCDPEENALFNQGWSTFSVQNYYNNQTRRYHLGTLTHHPSADLRNVEYTFGDAITAVQMRDAFFTVTALTPDPFAWTLRPQDATQVNRVRAVEGTVPLVGPKAPFENLVFQGLATGVAFGTLTYVATDELENTTLGSRVIVITNDVPNDIDFVAGLITETFQTPLAHVNLLSQSRNTPNMALPDASRLPEFQPLIGKLVRLEVNEGGYSVRTASLEEAQAFWDAQQTGGDVLVPRLDRTTTQLIDLQNADFDDLPTIGAKASQLAEVLKVNQSVSACAEGAAFAVPEKAFAIPAAHYLAHMQASGAQTYVDTLLEDELFHTDLAYRKVALQTLQQMILDHPVDAALLSQVTSWVSTRFGNKAVRFRSSSNTEDLAEFNGAGLYESLSAELDDEDARVDDAMRTVWASLWNLRAFEERTNANVDQSAVAMGILVHLAFKNERANGVAVGRNILDPTRVDQYYFNSQAGEASVTNPAPGIITEQLIYQWPPRTPTLTYHSYSSLQPDTRVITAAEARALACSVDAIQTHLRERLDPDGEDRWFTVETEFKFLGAERQLLIKQARPYQLRKLDIPNDCREEI